jgi:hypothetical protein
VQQLHNLIHGAGSSSSDPNPIQTLGSFLEAREHISDHFGKEAIVLRRKVLEKDKEIENLKSELELLKKDKEKAEKDKKEAEDMFMKINDDYDQIVGLYEIIYNHFHLGDAGVNSPKGIISPLDCRQGNFPMNSEQLVDLKSRVEDLCRQLLGRDQHIDILLEQIERIPVLEAEVESLSRRVEKAETDYGKVVDLYETIYNHFRLGDAGANGPEGIISPLDCRQGNFPSEA